MTTDGLTWRKSSYSNGTGGDCIEVASLPNCVVVRDTKDRTRPAVRYTATAWAAFVQGVKDGEFE